MKNVLEEHKPWNLIQEKLDNLISSKHTKGVEFVVQNLSLKITVDLEGLSGEFYLTGRNNANSAQNARNWR